MWQDGEHEAREEKLFGDAARHALALCLFFFFLQGSPGFGIPGQPGLKGDPGDRVSGATHGVWKGGANRHTGRFRGNISVAAAGVFAPDCGRQC